MADDDSDRVWELMEKISICMLSTTHDGERIRSRPMAAFVRRDEGASIFSATKSTTRTRKSSSIRMWASPSLTDRNSCRSPVTLPFRDREKMKELWGPSAQAWWDSPDDPSIRLLAVTPDDAAFWDGPGKIVGTIKMLTAAATNTPPNYGTNRKVTM